MRRLLVGDIQVLAENFSVSAGLVENEFLELDSKFKEIRNLKDLYEEFNSSYVNDPEGATQRLNELIKIYKESKIDIFISFSNLLQKYFDSIINSFTYITIKSDSTYHDSLIIHFI